MAQDEKRLVVGVDPGLTGELAFVELPGEGMPLRVLGIEDMPVEGGQVCAVRLGRLLAAAASAYLNINSWLVMERQIAMPGRDSATGVRSRSMGAVSAMNFGRGGGIVEGCCAGLGIRFSTVGAMVWKVSLGMAADKKESLVYIRGRFPEAAKWLTRAKDHGRGDALGVAAWACGLRAA